MEISNPANLGLGILGFIHISALELIRGLVPVAFFTVPAFMNVDKTKYLSPESLLQG